MLRYRPGFFDQIGHQTTYASNANRHFFTILCHRQTYQNYEQSRRKLGTFLENKVLQKSKFSKNFVFKTWCPGLIFFTKKNLKDSIDFWCWKMTESTNLQSLRLLFINWVGLMMSWFSEKMLISNICRHGLMPNLIKKPVRLVNKILTL